MWRHAEVFVIVAPTTSTSPPRCLVPSDPGETRLGMSLGLDPLLNSVLEDLDKSHLPAKSPSKDTDLSTFLDERMVPFIFLVTGIAVLLFLAIMSVRDYYWRKHGVGICAFVLRGRNRQTEEDLSRDRVLAEELQRQLNQEGREADRMAKRRDRRKWYEYYIKPYTTTIKEDDIFYAHEIEEEVLNEEPPVPGAKRNPKVLKRIYSSTLSEEDDEELDDMEKGVGETVKSLHPEICQETDDDAHLYVRLTIDASKGLERVVDGQCAICVCEYEDGDKVVWSGLHNCRHAFHYDCMLPWLSKGKKRCPICRHWFVPGARIEDQKKALEERLRKESVANISSEITAPSSSSSDDGSDSTNEVPVENDGSPTLGVADNESDAQVP